MKYKYFSRRKERNMENTKGKTLHELLEEEFKQHVKWKYGDIARVLEDEKECQRIINHILNDNAYDQNENQKTLGVTQERAKHILITYLIGSIFSTFGGLGEKIRKDLLEGDELDKIWMPTALYHDYGYYDEHIKEMNYVLEQHFKPYLLNEKEIESLQELRERVMAYKLEEITNYDKYIRDFHERQALKNGEKQNEVIDHGIFGAVKVYARQKKKAGRNERFKCVCLTIAQHNIFKSDGNKTDVEYKKYNLERLNSRSELRIDERTPLLLFLSLVDTIECAKKLGKKKNKKAYLEMKTILDNISVSITPDILEVNYSKLAKKVDAKKRDELHETYKKYIESVEKIGDWTSFECIRISSDIFEIKMRSNEKKKAA